MEIRRIDKLAECLDGVTVREYVLSDAIGPALIAHLGTEGRLEVFPFAKTFFRIAKTGAYLMKGIEGAATLNVVYSRFRQEQEQQLLDHIGAFDTEEKHGRRIES